MEEEMKQLVSKMRSKINDEIGPVLDVAAYQQGWYTGYLAALNEILEELNKPTITPCEYHGMGFD